MRPMEAVAPTVEQIRAARQRLRELIAETPLWPWRGDAVEQAAGRGTQVLLKLELFQHAGSFKPRGALCAMMDLAPEALRRGVTAVSAGNHAMAVGYAARALGTSAKVVMPRTASPARVQGCRDYGAEVRSEEHTSELQSRSELVCRLLLEKKKKNQQRPKQNKNTQKQKQNKPKPTKK